MKFGTGSDDERYETYPVDKVKFKKRKENEKEEKNSDEDEE